MTLADARAILSSPAPVDEREACSRARAEAAALVKFVGGGDHFRKRDVRTGDILPPTLEFTACVLMFPSDNFPTDEPTFHSLPAKVAVGYKVVAPKVVDIADLMPCAFPLNAHVRDLPLLVRILT